MKPKKSFSTVRETISIEDQIQEQLRAYRAARNVGHLQGMENTISGLFDVLGPWVPKDDKKLYNDTKYAPKEMSEFYTDADIVELKDYGELEDDRINEIKNLQNQYNRKEFYAACDERIKILMNTFKKLGLGFQEEETAIISHDKKKVTTTEKSS